MARVVEPIEKPAYVKYLRGSVGEILGAVVGYDSARIGYCHVNRDAGDIPRTKHWVLARASGRARSTKKFNGDFFYKRYLSPRTTAMNYVIAEMARAYFTLREKEVLLEQIASQ